MILKDGAVLLIDKISGISSYDVIRKLKPIFKKVKIGHAGTLDVLASGLLIICIGKATKLIKLFQQLQKNYITEIVFGINTDTDDITGEVITTKEVDITNLKDKVKKSLENFRGEIMQKPPVYSALKINGKRAYALARKGEKPELKERKVNIYKIEMIEVIENKISFDIICSKGTYIRSLARDIGEAVGTGGSMSVLRRVSIGDFNVNKALSSNDINEGNVKDSLISTNKSLSFLEDYCISNEDAKSVLNGIMPTELVSRDLKEPVSIRDESNNVVAIVEKGEKNRNKFVTVFN